MQSWPESVQGSSGVSIAWVVIKRSIKSTEFVRSQYSLGRHQKVSQVLRVSRDRQGSFSRGSSSKDQSSLKSLSGVSIAWVVIKRSVKSKEFVRGQYSLGRHQKVNQVLRVSRGRQGSVSRRSSSKDQSSLKSLLGVSIAWVVIKRSVKS